MSRSSNNRILRALKAIGGAVLCTFACLSITVNGLAIVFDPAFGDNGKFMTTFAETGQPSGSGFHVYVQPFGRVVLVGSHQQQGVDGRLNGIAIAGLKTDGTLDSNFSNNGKRLIWSPTATQNLADSAMLADGSILLLHQFTQLPLTNAPVLVKLTPSGHPDAGFTANVEITLNQTLPVKLAPAANGKIYVMVRQMLQFSIIRLNADGSRDSTFGTNGVKDLNLNRFPQPTIFGFHEHDGGKLLVVGYQQNPVDYNASFVARFDSDLNLDRTFGMQGVVRISIAWGSVYGQTSAIQSDGKIVLGGYYTFLGSRALLVRLTPRGRLDPSFDGDGIAMTEFNDWNGVHGIAIAPDGKIVVTGRCGAKAVPTNQRLFVARFSSGGVRESFLVTNFITDREAGANDVALQADGKAVVAAFTQNLLDNSTQLAGARFLP